MSHFTPIEAHLFVGFFGDFCVFNRSMLIGVSMMLTILGMGWGDRQRCKGIDRFVWTILLMAGNIVVLQWFLNG